MVLKICLLSSLVSWVACIFLCFTVNGTEPNEILTTPAFRDVVCWPQSSSVKSWKIKCPRYYLDRAFFISKYCFLYVRTVCDIRIFQCLCLLCLRTFLLRVYVCSNACSCPFCVCVFDLWGGVCVHFVYVFVSVMCIFLVLYAIFLSFVLTFLCSIRVFLRCIYVFVFYAVLV